jgi:hypothetical protein
MSVDEPTSGPLRSWRSVATELGFGVLCAQDGDEEFFEYLLVDEDLLHRAGFRIVQARLSERELRDQLELLGISAANADTAIDVARNWKTIRTRREGAVWLW